MRADEDLIEKLSISFPGQCAYYPDRESLEEVLIDDGVVHKSLQNLLLDSGFRRYAHYYYRSVCPHCRACTSYRVPVKKFKPSRSQRRVLKKNRNISVEWGLPAFTEEKLKVYLKYQYRQHFLKPGGMDPGEYNEQKLAKVMLEQMYTNPSDSIEAVFYSGNRVYGFAVFDIADSVLSAVYLAYDHDFYDMSPGTYIILKGFEYAAEQKIDYMHLGYFIRSHPKMNYKENFRPGEILHHEKGWVSVDSE